MGRDGGKSNRSPRRAARSRSRRRRRSSPRSRSRRRGREPQEAAQGSEVEDGVAGDLFGLEVLTGKGEAPLQTFDIVECTDAASGITDASAPLRRVPHVCARPGEAYAIRVTNRSRRHVACCVYVDGEFTLLKDGSLIVAPGEKRELPGYLVSKNFVGKEYVKEYRDFRFGKPRVVEVASGSSSSSSSAPQAFKSYGVITCDVYEAVLDEEIEADKELRGQTTWYRGAGLNGSFEERQVPEGKKSHLLYSSVTVQGPRSSISNTTAGRWWVRGDVKLRTLEVRYREAHSLMLLGVDPRDLGLMEPKDEEDDAEDKVKKEDWLKKEEKNEQEDLKSEWERGVVEMCDLTAENDDNEASCATAGVHWSVVEAAEQAAPVDVCVA